MADERSHDTLKPPRYTRRPFPDYAYLPGRDPHPTRDPDGHSYQAQSPELKQFNPGQWQDCEEYLYAIDLLNHGYYWEAHESFEAVWIAAGRRQSEPGEFVQGLLQIGVGLLKLRQGHIRGAETLMQAGRSKIRQQSGNRSYLGIDPTQLDELVSEVLQYGADVQPVIRLVGTAEISSDTQR
jgi:uncharacterized protein